MTKKDAGGLDVEIPEPRLAKIGELLTLHRQDGCYALRCIVLFPGRVVLRRLHLGDTVWIAGLSSKIKESLRLNEQNEPFIARVEAGKTGSKGKPSLTFQIIESESRHRLGLSNLNREVKISLKKASPTRPGSSQEQPESLLERLIPEPAVFGIE